MWLYRKDIYYRIIIFYSFIKFGQLNHLLYLPKRYYDISNSGIKIILSEPIILVLSFAMASKACLNSL